MTCSMAYKKSTLERIGGFDERYSYHEDRDLGLRARRLGRVFFNPKMIVYHQRSVLEPREFVHRAKHIRNWVLICRKFQEEQTRFRRVVYPLNLMAMLYPPLVIGSIIRHRFKTKEDFALFPYIYVRVVYERLGLWNECAKQSLPDMMLGHPSRIGGARLSHLLTMGITLKGVFFQRNPSNYGKA
jgi:GT2 family glycosyltransferase